MIKPINKMVLIEPATHESFVMEQKETYDEVGIVIDIDNGIYNGMPTTTSTSGTVQFPISKSVKVYFDSWQASKFPKGNNEYYWLVPFDSIKAYEIPEK